MKSLALLFCLLLAVPFLPSGARAAGASPSASVAAPRTDLNSMLAHEDLLNKARAGGIDLYFLGDSITRRWGATDYPDFLAHWKKQFFGWNAGDFGWGADGIQNILWRIEHGELDGVHPKVIVLLAGTNNVGTTPPDDARVADIVEGLRTLIALCQRKAPGATIILTAIFPRNDNPEVVPGINRINAEIATFADGKRVRFLNVNAGLADENGRLFDGMTVDKLHPSLKGYEVWADGLRPLLLELLGPPAEVDHAPPPTGDPSAKARAAAPVSGRERVLLDDGWRFGKGDPAGNTVCLLYDVRPEVKNAKDDKAADSEPEEAARLAAAGTTVLKPWILPSGNAFIADPSKRHVRPEGDPGSAVDYVKASFDDRAWREVTLPHDWAIEGPFLTEGDFGGMGRLPSWGIGWYRRKLTVPAADAGKRVVLEIDGAMSYATVWVNGHLAGGWPYGYSSWQVDMTPYLNFGGDNQLAVRLDNPPSSSRWYPGAGLYRNVWLTKTQPVHVAPWGTRLVTSEISAASATVTLGVEIANDSAHEVSASVATQFFSLDAEGRRTGSALGSIQSVDTTVVAGGRSRVQGAALLASPKLWGPPPTQQPHRHVAVTTVSVAGKVVDTFETRFGIRSVVFDPDAGLLVNGEHVRIQGVNQHHDLGSLGAAFNVRAARRQLELLREMGCNAVRLSHNPPAPELLELTDQMGFLVLDEAFDVWERKKTPLDFHLVFPDWHEPDLRALVRRDRNHPSVILWSIGNEVGEQYTGEAGAAIARRLTAIVKEEDPTRLVTCAMNFAKPDFPLPAELDVIGLNYQGEGIRYTPEFVGTDRIRTAPQYDPYHVKFPRKPILSTETASAFSSRGVYLFPVSKEQSAPVRDGRGGDDATHQVTAYELHAVDFGSSAEKVFASLEKHPFVAGEFVWTGWDHLGEPTPYYTSRSAYAGIIDLAGFPKDRFFLYQSHWRPEFPMAHLLPHWTWPERVGQVTPVHVFTSGDEAELFLNGRSLGRRVRGKFEYRLRWDEVVYEPGVLEVVAYRNGVKWATDRVETAGPAAALALEADRPGIGADGSDLSFITASVVDGRGVLVPRSHLALEFTLDGPGEIVATDNGDPTSFEAFQAPRRKAFGGKCLVIVRGKPGQPGKLQLTAKGPAVEAAVATLTTVVDPR